MMKDLLAQLAEQIARKFQIFTQSYLAGEAQFIEQYSADEEFTKNKDSWTSSLS